MSDYKTRYSSLVTMRKVQAAVDKALDKLIKSGHTRKETYGQGWQKVNLNEIVERFAPGSTPRPVGGKVEFYNPGSPVKVVVDVGGGYCRLQKMPQTTRKAQYLDINGNDAHNYKTPDGKTKGRTHAEYLQVTHFLLKKKGES